MSSALPFPIPWYLIPLNIYLTIRLILSVAFGPHNKSLAAGRKAHGLPGKPPLADLWHTNITYICPSIPETDYPLIYSPPDLHLCGPITVDPIPVATADPELSKWLDESKDGVVYVSLGTYFKYNNDDVRNMLGGLVQGLPARVRVLWKLNGKDRFKAIIDGVLKEEKNPERFMLVDWLEADPAGVLEHSNVVCSVHHGGANSFFETCRCAHPCADYSGCIDGI